MVSVPRLWPGGHVERDDCRPCNLWGQTGDQCGVWAWSWILLVATPHPYCVTTLLGVRFMCVCLYLICRNCLKHAHEPCECQVWDHWLQDIVDMSQGASFFPSLSLSSFLIFLYSGACCHDFFDTMIFDTDKDLTKVADKAEADARWIIDNTKPCPSCDAPIQKNEGCNQMTCRKVGGVCNATHAFARLGFTLPCFAVSS